MKRLLFRGAQVFEVVHWPEDEFRAYGVGSVGTREPEQSRDEPAAAQTVDTASNWFKLQVLDDETGNPVPGVSVELRLPGSEPQKYDTDGQGKIQVSNLMEGVADILSVSDQEAYEVVSLD